MELEAVEPEPPFAGVVPEPELAEDVPPPVVLEPPPVVAPLAWVVPAPELAEDVLLSVEPELPPVVAPPDCVVPAPELDEDELLSVEPEPPVVAPLDWVVPVLDEAAWLPPEAGASGAADGPDAAVDPALPAGWPATEAGPAVDEARDEGAAEVVEFAWMTVTVATPVLFADTGVRPASAPLATWTAASSPATSAAPPDALPRASAISLLM